MKFAFVLGTRPEIIKLSPVIRECKKRGIDFDLVHSGQHYSDSLSDTFFKQLELPRPNVNLNVGSGSHGEQTGKILKGVEQRFLETEPDVVLVQGDTNTTMAAALAASKLNPIVGHIEAGLRSYDWSMPEEINRIIADNISNHLFPPTENAKETLLQEGFSEDHITVTGNTIVDAVHKNKKLADKKSNILSRLSVKPDKYSILTAHRQENVDDPDVLANIFTGVSKFADSESLPIIYPVHPRTQKIIENNDIYIPDSIALIDPIEFLDFLKLEANAKLIFTDSGGVQEEACILRTPCVTIRENTERPETLEVGANVLAGTDADSIVNSASKMLGAPQDWRNPFGDGDSAEKILDAFSDVA